MSTSTHAALVALAVAATVGAPDVPGSRTTERITARLFFVTPPPPAPPPDATAGRAASTRRAATRAARRRPSTAPAFEQALAGGQIPAFDLDVPQMEDRHAALEARVLAGIEFGGGLDAPGGTGAVPAPVYGDVYSEWDAERRPVALGGSRGPEYPMPLLLRRISGTVIARFVIDSTGRPVTASLQIVSSSDELFTRSVRDAVRRTRYRPAQLAGRTVNVLVEQPFRFIAR